MIEINELSQYFSLRGRTPLQKLPMLLVLILSVEIQRLTSLGDKRRAGPSMAVMAISLRMAIML